MEEGNLPCEAAGKALTYSIIGFFCFGIVLGPMAIAKAVEARRQIHEEPSLGGLAKANVGMMLGIMVFFFWAIGMIMKFKQMGAR